MYFLVTKLRCFVVLHFVPWYEGLNVRVLNVSYKNLFQNCS